MKISLFVSILYIYCLAVSSYISDYPFLIGNCNTDCTFSVNLPCKTHYKAIPCPLETKWPQHLWPAAPDNFQWSYKHEAKDGACLARLEFKWTVPNDKSGLSVKGFQLQLVSLSGSTVNEQMCVTLDLSASNWTEQDIVNQVPFNSTCLLVPPGEYYADLYSLPKPPGDAIDKHDVIPNFHVPQAYMNNGKCRLPEKTTEHRMTRKQTSPSSIRTQKTAPTTQPVHIDGETEKLEKVEDKSPWVVKGMGIGIGGVIGLLLVTLLVIVLKRPFRRHANNPGPMDDESLINTTMTTDEHEDPDYYRPSTPPPGEGSHLSYDEGFVRPVNPTDMDSVIGSELFANINGRTYYST